MEEEEEEVTALEEKIEKAIARMHTQRTVMIVCHTVWIGCVLGAMLVIISRG